MKLFLCLGAATLLAAGILPADVTYTQTTKFEGGTMVEMMQKMASNPLLAHMGGGGMRQAFQDQEYDVYVKGNKMARWGKVNSTIYDLDAGTITNIDNAKQTYRTMTFEEMQQRMEQAQQHMNHGQQGDLDFDVKVSSTGQTREMDGQTAKETLIVMTAKQASSQGQMVVTTHAWLLPFTSASKEVMDFQRKLMAKYAGAFTMGGPGMASAGKGLSAAMAEAMKQDGYAALTETSITGVAAAGPMGGGNSDPNAPLIKTATESAHFAQGGVDDSKFVVPAGFKEDKHGR